MYERYVTYKPIDESWLDEIPSHWQTAFLSSLFDEHKQKNKSLQNKNLLSLSYGRIIRKDINGKSGLLPESFETYNVIAPNDIVLRLTDLQNDHRSLRTGLSKDDGIVTSAYVTLRRRAHNINAAYFHYFLHTFDVHKCFYGMGDGVRQSLSYDGIKRLTLIIPPETEQQRIVDFLDYQTMLINRLIKGNKKKIELLVEYMNKLFFDIHQQSEKSTKIKRMVTLRQDYISPEAKKQYSKAGMYNRGRGIFKRDPVLGENLGTSSFQWIKKNCVMISGQFAWEGATYITSEMDEGALVSHRYYLLDVISDLITPAYLWAYFMSDEGFMKLNLCSHGAAGRNRPLNIKELLNVEIPLPNNRADLEKIEAAARLIMSYRLIDKQETELIDEFKRCLISYVVTGQIDVRDIKVPKFEYVEEIEDSSDENEDEESIEEEV